MKRAIAVFCALLVSSGTPISWAVPPEDTRIADAAQQDDKVAVRKLLQQKAAVNGKQGDGSTALHWAAWKDDVELVQLLLDAGADVKAATRIGGLTPLSMAAQNGSPRVIDALLKAGADAKTVSSEGTTVLMTASASGNPEAVKLLLDHSADPNAREKTYGQTALMFAAALNRADVIKLLIARGADPNIATRLTKLERIRLDIDGNVVPPDGAKGAPNKQNQEAGKGKEATKEKEPAKEKDAGSKTAQTEQKPNAEPPPEGDLKAQVAVLTKQVQTLTARINELEKGQTDKGETPREQVAKEQSSPEQPAKEQASKEQAPKEQAKPGAGQAPQQSGRRGGKAGDLVFQGPREVGATVIGGMSALLFAAREGHLAAARELIDGGANINEVSESDRTSPLVMAIINGHLDLAKYLLDHGASPNLATTAGLTPLIATIDVQWAPHAWFPQPNLTQEKTSYLDLMKALLDHGANPNSRLTKKLWFRGLAQDPTWVEPAGATAFWRAAQATDVAAMKLLVAAGADPHIPNLAGDTPLMVAAGVGWMANHTANDTDHWLAAVKYCVELGEDVNAVDSRGYTPLHGAAYIGNNPMVMYLVDKGAKVDVKTKAGDTVADMANGPTRFGLPHPETVALLEKLGSPNSHNCRSDQCLVAPKEDKKPATATAASATNANATPKDAPK